MAKKITLLIPDETYNSLQSLSAGSEISLSASTTASIEYFTYLLSEQEKGYKIMLERTVESSKYVKELPLPQYRLQKLASIVEEVEEVEETEEQMSK